MSSQAIRPKSTGKHSENNHALGHAGDIAEQLTLPERPITRREVLWHLLCDAMDDGYPGKQIGERRIPQDWALATSEQATMVIEAAHHFADRFSLWLTEYINGYDRAPLRVYYGKDRKPA